MDYIVHNQLLTLYKIAHIYIAEKTYLNSRYIIDELLKNSYTIVTPNSKLSKQCTAIE